MRKIEMRSVDPEQPAIVEFVEGRRYMVVVNVPEGTTERHRAMIAREVSARIPDGKAGVLAMPHGYTIDVYEDAPVGEPLIRERA